MIADRWLGQRYSVIIGGVIMAVGRIHADGAAAVLRRSAAADRRQRLLQAEHLDPGRQPLQARRRRIDRAYSIFYVGINVGAFFSPLICGSAREGSRLRLPWGFFAAGIGMVIGLIIYMFALAHAAARIASARLQAPEPKRKSR